MDEPDIRDEGIQDDREHFAIDEVTSLQEGIMQEDTREQQIQIPTMSSQEHVFVTYPKMLDDIRVQVLNAISQTYYAHVPTTIGGFYLAYKGRTLRFLSTENEEVFLNKAQSFLGTVLIHNAGSHIPLDMIKQVQVAIENNKAYEGPLDYSKLTRYEQAVLERIRCIPIGETWTYAEIAQAIGHPGSAAAVKRAILKNPFSVLIPSHRVVPTNGMLDRDNKGRRDLQKALMVREGIPVDKHYRVPTKKNANSVLPNEPRQHLFKTGNLVDHRAEGAIEFLDRIDYQVKIRSFRIKLGEIEAVLRQNPAIKEVVVVNHEDTPGNKRLVAYLVLEPTTQQEGLFVEDLRNILKETLPHYMIPSAFVRMDTLPLMSNGKVNHKALPTPDTDHSHLKAAYVAPRTPIEHLLAQIWSQVLGIEKVGIHDNYFALGGASIQALQMIAKANTAGLPLTVEMLFEQQTIAKLAAVAGSAQPLQPQTDSRNYKAIQVPQTTVPTERLPMQSGTKNTIIESTGVYLPPKAVITKEELTGCHTPQQEDFQHLPTEEDKPTTGASAVPSDGKGTSALSPQQQEHWMQIVQARYLNWLIKRYEHIHMEGTFPGIRQVKLSKIYFAPRIYVTPKISQGRNNRLDLLAESLSVEDKPDQYVVNGLERVIRDCTHVVLLGYAGTGKTTALRHLALVFAQQLQQAQEQRESNEIPLPIPLQLKDYVREGYPMGKSLRDFVAFYFESLGCPSEGLAELLEKRFVEGNCLILLDGLDEVSDRQLQYRLVRHLNQLVAHHSNSRNRFVITSRVTGYYDYFSESFTYSILRGLNKNEISMFFQSWTSVLEMKDEARRAFHTPILLETRRQEMVDLETLGRIARMAIIHIDDRGNLAPVTPLLLQIIFIVHHMLIQPNYKRSEIQELVANTISYVKISHAHLPFSAIREYLTSLLSKAIYSQYLSRQSRESDTQRVEERTKPTCSGKHEHPSSAVEEVIQVLRNGWADLGETWSEDHPDMKIRNEVREILLAIQEYKLSDENIPIAKIREDVNKLLLAVINQTDQFVLQTRSLLT